MFFRSVFAKAILVHLQYRLPSTLERFSLAHMLREGVDEGIHLSSSVIEVRSNP
jgi:hypothetical protein